MIAPADEALDAIAENGTDHVHFNTSTIRNDSEGNISLPNDSGLSLNSTYSNVTAPDPGSRLVPVS